jgi:hypothetical protein
METEIFIGIGMSLRETLGQKIEFRGSLRLPNARLKAGSHGDPMIIALVKMSGVGKELINIADGNPELRVEDEIDATEIGWGNADDGVRMARERDGFAKDVGIGSKTRFPDAIAEDDDGRVLFVGAESTAEGEGELGDVEEICGGGLAPEAFGIAVSGDGGGEKFIETGDTGEGFGVVANVAIERPREVAAAFVAVRGVEREKSGRIADGRGVENETGDHSEDGSVGTDAESESENGDRGEDWFAAKKTGRETEIAEKRFEEGERAVIADGFFGLLEAAEFEEGVPARFVGGHAFTQVVVNVECEVRGEFVLHLSIELGFAEEVAEAVKVGTEIHRWASWAKTRAKKKGAPAPRVMRVAPWKGSGQG